MLKNIPDFTQSVTVAQPKKKLNISLTNIILTIAAILFVASVAFWVSTQSLTTNTQATMETQMVNLPSATPTPSNNYPKSFKGQPIPENIYADAVSSTEIPDSDKIEYVNRQIMKYYLYGEISTENELGEPQPVGTFAELSDAVAKLEDTIKNKFFSSADFAFIHIRFAGAGANPELKNLYPSPENKAEEVIKRYQQSLVLGELSPEQIIAATENDEELKNFSSQIKNEIITGYSAEKSLFSEDSGFNGFLFSQPANQVSNVYTVKDASKMPVAYVIVYPTKVTKLEYDSIDEMITEHKKDFAY